jgi:hypothetical protein
MCPFPNGFRDRAISLYSSKIVDKKEILRTVSNTGIYFHVPKLVQFFENSTVNINALCNSSEEMALLVRTVFCTVKLLYLGNRSE